MLSGVIIVVEDFCGGRLGFEFCLIGMGFDGLVGLLLVEGEEGLFGFGIGRTGWNRPDITERWGIGLLPVVLLLLFVVPVPVVMGVLLLPTGVVNCCEDTSPRLSVGGLLGGVGFPVILGRIFPVGT